jgi:HEAT repeat protein
MLIQHCRSTGIALLLAAISSVGVYAASPAPGESKRLAQAKDLIAEEQWTRAIEVLRVATADPKETARDEAIYWLAHSLYHAGDSAAALEAIRRLEREYPASLWVKPAGALRIEMAVRLQRNDVLWWTAVPPPPPPPPPAPPRPMLPPEPAKVFVTPPAPPSPPRPASVWIPENFQPDIDLRVQALGYLIQSDAAKVIPVLKQIALESQYPGPAGRAVFVLAQSGKPEARETVVEVAKTGPEPVRLVAVRELGRFGGADISNELLQVYSMSDLAVKRQVVKSLGERLDQPALLTIVKSEKDADLRKRAIVTLGTAGGSEPLRVLYRTASPELRRAIILGLFNARAEDDLILIAQRERDAALRNEIHNYLGMLDTPKAREYLRKVNQNR